MTRRTPWIGLSLALVSAAQAEPALERALVSRPFAAEDPVRDLALSPDGRVVLGAVGGRVALWAADSGRRLGQLPGRDAVDSLATAGELVITGEDMAARVRVWDVTRREVLAELLLDPRHEPYGDYELGSGLPLPPVVALAASPDGALVAAAWKDQVRVLRLPELELVRSLRIPVDREEQVGGDRGDLHVVRWDDDGRVLRAWNADRNQGWSWDLARAPVAMALPLGDPRVRPDSVWAHAMTRLGGGDVVELRSRRDAGGVVSFTLERVDPYGAPRWSTPVPAGDVFWSTTLLALEDRGVLLLSGEASSARYALDTGLRQRAHGPYGLRGLFASQTDSRLVVWDGRNRLWTWDAAQGDDPYRLATPELPLSHSLGGWVALLDVDPSLRYAAAELLNGEVLLWNLRSGEVLQRWRDGDGANQSGLAVRSGGGAPRCFYNALAGDGRVKVADGRTLIDYSAGVRLVARGVDPEALFLREPLRGTRFALSADGQTLLADDATRVVALGSERSWSLPNDLRYARAQAVSRRGAFVAVAGMHQRAQELLVFERRGDAWVEAQRVPLIGVAQAVTFSPDEQVVVAVDLRGALAVDLRSGARTRIELEGGAAAAFLPDGRLALGARDGSVTVWSLSD